MTGTDTWGDGEVRVERHAAVHRCVVAVGDAGAVMCGHGDETGCGVAWDSSTWRPAVRWSLSASAESWT